MLGGEIGDLGRGGGGGGFLMRVKEGREEGRKGGRIWLGK